MIFSIPKGRISVCVNVVHLIGFNDQDSQRSNANKFNIFVKMVNSIPQPHHRANMVCYVCDDVRMFQENGDSESNKSIVAQTSWIISVLKVAREGCCLCTLMVQAVAALGNGHFQNPHFNACLQVKDIDGIKRYSIRQSQLEGPSVIELCRNAYEPTSCTLRSRIRINILLTLNCINCSWLSLFSY